MQPPSLPTGAHPPVPTRPPPPRTTRVPTSPAPPPPVPSHPPPAHSASLSSPHPPLPSVPPPSSTHRDSGDLEEVRGPSKPAFRPPPPNRAAPVIDRGNANPSSVSSTSTLGGGRTLPSPQVKTTSPPPPSSSPPHPNSSAQGPPLNQTTTSPSVPMRREPSFSPQNQNQNSSARLTSQEVKDIKANSVSSPSPSTQGFTRSFSVDNGSSRSNSSSSGNNHFETPPKNSFLNLSSGNLTSGMSSKSSTSKAVTKDKPKKGGILKLFGIGKQQNYTNRVADYLRQMEEDTSDVTAGLFSSLAKEIEKMDTWTSKDRVFPDWSEISADYSKLDREYSGMLEITKSQAEGFQYEFGKNNSVYGNDSLEIEDADRDVCYYEKFFAKSDQANYLTEGEEDTAVGATSISFIWNNSVTHLSTEESQETKVILRTKKKTTRFLVPAMESTSRTNILKHIKTLYPELQNLKLTRMAEGFNHELIPKFCEYEKQTIFKKYKFGVLYVKDGQTEENDMFSNTEMSPDFEDFLNFIGERMTLQGWTNFRGGLDVKRNATGLQSVYTKFKDFEIMYHVSTLLPFQPDDLQRVERKRHLGNDVVQIMFKEGDTPFDPLTLRTHYNHVFIVISVAKKEKGKTFYKIAIANKAGVPPYGPYLKYPPVYEKNDAFRELLLTKFVNAERASMYATDFKTKIIRTNKTLLEEISKDYIARNKEEKPAVTSFSGSEESNAGTPPISVVSNGNQPTTPPLEGTPPAIPPKSLRRKSLDGNEVHNPNPNMSSSSRSFVGATVREKKSMPTGPSIQNIFQEGS